MVTLSIASKHYNIKMKDILLIFSEREAQRILLSKWSLLRNPFIEQEEPQINISDHNWFEFLQNQLIVRRWLFVKLKQTLPKIFDEHNYDGLIKRLFTEIKKPSESPPKLIKTNNSIALRTSFQAMLYCHWDLKTNRRFEVTVIDQETGKYVIGKSNEFKQEIDDNSENIWLEDLRWYRSKHEVSKPPKSSFLRLLFWLESLIKCHCEAAHKVIESKRNTENFLDEYSTRWVSYSDLIMSMEEQMWFVEDVVNEMTSSSTSDVFTPKYSILRMMWRIWGKYVMKKLLSGFIDKIKDLLCQYHDQIHKIGLDYQSIVWKKYGISSLKQKWNMNPVIRDLLLQSIQMIVDVSLNEISINYLESTHVHLGNFYSQVEDVMVQQVGKFLEDLAQVIKPSGYIKLTSLYFSEIKSIWPKTTQRKLHELILKYQIERWERVIRRSYIDFSKDSKYKESKQSSATKRMKFIK